jgi:hypothetical protein
MRWLFVKDLQILKRSPLLVVLLVIYPIAIALMTGFAISSPPGKPTVAILDEVPPGKGTINFGSQQINVSTYADQLYQSIKPLRVDSREEAVAKVRWGAAAAALIVPADITQEIQSLLIQGVGTPCCRCRSRSSPWCRPTRSRAASRAPSMRSRFCSRSRPRCRRSATPSAGRHRRSAVRFCTWRRRPSCSGPWPGWRCGDSRSADGLRGDYLHGREEGPGLVYG